MLNNLLNIRNRLSLKQKTKLISTGICLAVSVTSNFPSYAMNDYDERMRQQRQRMEQDNRDRQDRQRKEQDE